jgi:hypothetical protein
MLSAVLFSDCSSSVFIHGIRLLFVPGGAPGCIAAAGLN